MRIIKNNKGQALVEFAIILPLLLLIIMGIVEFGMMLNSYLTIRNDSREAARAGIVGSSYTEMRDLIISISPNLDVNNLAVSVSPSDGNRKSGDTLTVIVTYKYHFTMPIISNIFNNDVILNAETSMRME